MSNKQIVTDLLAELPDDVTLTEIVEELSILAAVERSERRLTEGDWIAHEDMEILSALRRARQASADGRVCSLEEARRKVTSEPRTERNEAERSGAE
jgi:hypothetical protein